MSSVTTTCFENVISYRGGCESSTPTSGLYLDQVGMHKSEIEKYIQAPYTNTEDLFNDMLNISIEELTKSIYQNFLPVYRPTSIISNARLGQINDNMILEDGDAGILGGVEFELCNHVSPIEFYLSEFSLFVDTTATVTVQVWDLQQNKMIDSFNVDTVANQISTVYLNKTYRANRKKLNLAFVYDTSLISSYQTQLGTSCGSCNPNTYYRHNAYLNARGASIASASDKILSNITSASHTYGISFIYSVNCNHQDWVCSVSNLLAMPILYKTAYNILNYGLNASTRQNSQTLGNREALNERLKQYDFNYTQQLNKLLTHMAPPKDPVCYECNDRIRTKTVLPG